MADIGKWDRSIKIGDLITAYHKGYWIVTKIERRFVEDNGHAHPGNPGDEYNPLIHYVQAFDAKFKPAKSKPRENRCDASFCTKITLKWIAEQSKKLEEEHRNMIEGYRSMLKLVEG